MEAALVVVLEAALVVAAATLVIKADSASVPLAPPSSSGIKSMLWVRKKKRALVNKSFLNETVNQSINLLHPGNWFLSWNPCEQTVALYSLLLRHSINTTLNPSINQSTKQSFRPPSRELVLVVEPMRANGGPLLTAETSSADPSQVSLPRPPARTFTGVMLDSGWSLAGFFQILLSDWSLPAFCQILLSDWSLPGFCQILLSDWLLPGFCQILLSGHAWLFVKYCSLIGCCPAFVKYCSLTGC